MYKKVCSWKNKLHCLPFSDAAQKIFSIFDILEPVMGYTGCNTSNISSWIKDSHTSNGSSDRPLEKNDFTRSPLVGLAYLSRKELVKALPRGKGGNVGPGGHVDRVWTLRTTPQYFGVQEGTAGGGADMER